MQQVRANRAALGDLSLTFAIRDVGHSVDMRRSFVEAGSPGVGPSRAGDNGIYV
jgi:hypothetical protein